MKKGLTLILASLLLCSCGNNSSKQTSDFSNTIPTSVTESVSDSSSQSSALSSSESSTFVEREFTNAKMEDLTVDYDGQPHTIEPTGYPEGTRVTYASATYFTDAGSYTITVLLSKDGYKNKTLSAVLTINCVTMNNVTFEDETVMYDGKAHSLTPKHIPARSSIAYTTEGGGATNTFTEKGTYKITATITNQNYKPKTLTATLKIIGYDEIYGVDESKQAYKFEGDLMWNDTFGELLKGNYTLLMYSGSRSSEEEDYRFKPGNSYTKIICDGKESFQESYITLTSGNYYKYEAYMIKDNDAICYTADFSMDNPYSYTKMPKEAMKETVIQYYPARAFVALQSVEGYLAPGVDLDDYYGSVGTFTVQDNRLIVKREHKRNGEYLYDIMEFYNVGNSKIDLPDSIKPSDEEVKNMAVNSYFWIGGVGYRYALVSTWNSPTEYMAHTYLYYWQQLIVEPGVHLVYPAIYDRKVERVVYTFYSETNTYNYNMTGYEVNLCFDRQGNYQGEYAELGTVVDRTSNFVSHGGVVHYYDEWATN